MLTDDLANGVRIFPTSLKIDTQFFASWSGIGNATGADEISRPGTRIPVVPVQWLSLHDMNL